MKMEQGVPKRRHIKFRDRGITQQKAYNIQNTSDVWSQELLVLYMKTSTHFWSHPAQFFL